MDQENIRQRLIESTIRVISRDGIDKATTKLLAKEADVNEVYIYRLFESKEALFVKTFAALDNELISKLLDYLPVMHMDKLKPKSRTRILFSCVWQFLLSNPEKCRCFISYYYSPYFKKYSCEAHLEAYRIIVEKLRPAFLPGADVWMLLNYIMDVLLTSAVKVFNGILPDNDRTAEHIFDLIYSAVEAQLVWTKKCVSSCEGVCRGFDRQTKAYA